MGARVVVAYENERAVAIVSDADAGRVDIVDIDGHKEIASLAVDMPGVAVILADGSIAVGTRDGVTVLSLDDDQVLRAERVIAVGHDVSGLALAPDEESLIVVGARMIEGFEIASGSRKFATALPLAPSAVTLDPEGKHALVTSKTASEVLLVDLPTQAVHLVTLDATGQDVEGAGHELWDAENKAWIFADGMMTNRTVLALKSQAVSARHAGAIAPTAEVAYIAHELLVPSAAASNAGEGLAPPTYGGSSLLSSAELLGVSILDMHTGNRISLHGAETKCRLPRGQVFDPSKRRLWVACGGTNEVIALEWSPNVRKNGSTLLRRPATYRVSRSYSLTAPPEGLAMDDEGRVLASTVWSSQLSIFQTDGSVEVVALSSGKSLGPMVARGRVLFHRSGDPRISVDGRTCATCHIDGDTDALEWRTKRGMRSTPVLAGRVDREGPFGWNGESTDLRAHIKHTIKENLGGKGISSTEVDDLDAYVRAMTPKFTTVAGRGEQVFVASGCAVCHTNAGRSTDAKLHRVEGSELFQTPSLVGLSRSGPYLHDGRYRTLTQLLDKTEGKMGTTHSLSIADRAALLGYLETL